MVWVKLDDQFFMHPKVVRAGKDATLLYIASLTYAAGQLTDGFIENTAVRLVGAMVDVATKHAKKLVEVGLWEETDGGYIIHDYHDYNPTRSKVLATREARAEAGSRGGKQKASNLLESCQANEQAKSKPSSTPYPYQEKYPPTPLPGEPPEPSIDDDEPLPTSKREPRRRTTAVPPREAFPITDERRAWAVELGFPEDRLEAERDRFLDYHGAKGNRFADWGKAWQMWLRNEVTWAAERGKISALPRYPNAAEMNRGGQGKVVL